MFSVLSFTLCFQLEVSFNDLYEGAWWALILYGFLAFCLVGCKLYLKSLIALY